MSDEIPGDNYRLFVIALLAQAVQDARRGDAQARYWVLEGRGTVWADAIDLPWPPRL